jgi:hypothetical protein
MKMKKGDIGYDEELQKYLESDISLSSCKQKIEWLEGINQELLWEHKQWAKILGHIIVSHIQGNHEALDVYQHMKIEYREGEPWVKSEAISKAEGRE